ncbi:hypothetical protein [Pedobacter rhodius]|uniref:DUF4377 domain-containing protein n=1 Tax=Pedobacter rhodius TaxID=3004098 RepID=A0ABT4KXK3_9SPHI|nr:hypothetical protein [Pedobacter sp. SJ11]MCZ4223658.1 hypothetical protein [Pedobacter sp. SJ11]
MRYLPLLLLTLLSFGCKKESENGKVVELFVDHYAASGKQMIYTLPDKALIGTYLEGFDERELGYTYRVRATLYIPDVAPMDGPSQWYTFVKVLDKELYKGTESFVISLKTSSIFTTNIAVRLENQTFYYGSYILRPENDAVRKQLEDVLALVPKFQTDSQYAAKVLIDATVVHDPNNRNNGYLVKSVKIQ